MEWIIVKSLRRHYRTPYVTWNVYSVSPSFASSLTSFSVSSSVLTTASPSGSLDSSDSWETSAVSWVSSADFDSVGGAVSALLFWALSKATLNDSASRKISLTSYKFIETITNCQHLQIGRRESQLMEFPRPYQQHIDIPNFCLTRCWVVASFLLRLKRFFLPSFSVNKKESAKETNLSDWRRLSAFCHVAWRDEFSCAGCVWVGAAHRYHAPSIPWR